MVQRVGQHRLLNVLISQAVGGCQSPCRTAEGVRLTDPLPVSHLIKTPAQFLKGLPSAVAADTTHPEGHASSAHSHSPQGNPSHQLTITDGTNNSTSTVSFWSFMTLEDSWLLQKSLEHGKPFTKRTRLNPSGWCGSPCEVLHSSSEWVGTNCTPESLI